MFLGDGAGRCVVLIQVTVGGADGLGQDKHKQDQNKIIEMLAAGMFPTTLPKTDVNRAAAWPTRPALCHLPRFEPPSFGLAMLTDCRSGQAAESEEVDAMVHSPNHVDGRSLGVPSLPIAIAVNDTVYERWARRTVE